MFSLILNHFRSLLLTSKHCLESVEEIDWAFRYQLDGDHEQETGDTGQRRRQWRIWELTDDVLRHDQRSRSANFDDWGRRHVTDSRT